MRHRIALPSVRVPVSARDGCSCSLPMVGRNQADEIEHRICYFFGLSWRTVGIRRTSAHRRPRAIRKSRPAQVGLRLQAPASGHQRRDGDREPRRPVCRHTCALRPALKGRAAVQRYGTAHRVGFSRCFLARSSGPFFGQLGKFLQWARNARALPHCRPRCAVRSEDVPRARLGEMMDSGLLRLSIAVAAAFVSSVAAQTATSRT